MEIKITKENFEKEVLNSEIPVLVDFYADWCGPCQRLSPILSEIAKEYDGKIKVGKVNVDAETELAIEFKALAIPTLIYFKDKKAERRLVGLSDKEEILAMFED